MIYNAQISEDEKICLRKLIGETVDKISTDGWSAAINTQSHAYWFLPEEIATPDVLHEVADVVRPKVEDKKYDTENEKVLATKLGKVMSINLISTFTTYSLPVKAEATKVLGVTIPEGVKMSIVFSRPEESLLERFAGPDDLALTKLDLAIEIITTLSRRILFYTNGVGYFVYAGVDREIEELLKTDQYISSPL